MVLPGQYKVKLTVDGQSQVQPLTVKMDPRVKTPTEGGAAGGTPPASAARNTTDGLQKQLELSLQCSEGLRQVAETLHSAWRRVTVPGKRVALKEEP
jgi:hypothetical protein